MKRKRVFLYAYNAANLGDDLFIHTITRRYPDVQFYIWAKPENQVSFASIVNLKALDPDSGVIRMLSGIRSSFAARYKTWHEKRCDAVVYIGGSLFIEYESWPMILNWWEYAARQYPFYVLGANFGPYQSEAYRARLETIFEQTQDVCFRDRYSRDKFAKCSKVRCAPDILFSYPIPNVEVREKQVFISVIHCGQKGEGSRNLGEYREGYVASMAQIIQGYLHEGYVCVLASFCRMEGDEIAIREILEAAGIAMDDARIRILCYDGTNADEMVREIAQSAQVIASRFHAAILGLAAGRWVFPVVYSDKTIRVLDDIGFDGKIADIRSQKIITHEQLREGFGCADAQKINEWRQGAHRHFAVLDRTLGRE
ncbi:MAG: polysaccharide pyruvyl transferase family protein [Candidatus Ventricola sp.]